MSDTDVSSDVFDVTIPIRFEPDDAQPASPAASLEKQMDREVEQVFREWDENVVNRKQSTFRIRPTSTSSTDKRRRRAASGGGGPGRSLGGATGSASRFEFPEIDVIRRDDVILNTSTESADDDATRRQFYVESPLTGSRLFRMEFDVSGYDQENVTVKLSGTRLVVHAIQHESDSGRKSTTEFCRKVKLPPDVNLSRIQCACSSGRLVVEAPTIAGPGRRSASGSMTPTLSVGSPKAEPLNKPLFRSAGSGRTLSLTVELGRMFRADDVVVKVRSHDKLVIHAERREQSAGSRLDASVTREFDLEEKVVPQSLKAGLTVDGLLKISAQVADIQVNLITNGLDNHPNGEAKN